MNNIKKILTLTKSQLKSNKGGEAVIVLMLTFMMICANIMIGTISDYAATLIYLMNPKAQNAITVINGDFFGDFSGIKNTSEVEYGIEVKCYNANLCTIYAVSEELFNEELFLSKDNIDAMKNGAAEGVPLLVSKSTGFNIGQKGTLSGGTKYEIVGIVEDDLRYFLFAVMPYKKFAIALDKGQFTALAPVTNPTMFVKLTNGTDKEEFKEKISSDGFSAINFDPLGTLSADFSNSIILSVIGTVTFTTSLFGVIINCYLVFGSRRKYYRALMTVGGKKKTFLQCGAIIKLFQLLLSIAVSVLGLLLFNLLLGNSVFNALSILISVALAVLLVCITHLLLNRWLDKLSCLEN